MERSRRLRCRSPDRARLMSLLFHSLLIGGRARFGEFVANGYHHIDTFMWTGRCFAENASAVYSNTTAVSFVLTLAYSAIRHRGQV